MQKFFLLIIVILGLGLASLGLIALVNESAARAETARGNAEAQIIRAEGQAALNHAQATSMLMSAAVPWGVLFVLGLLGLAVVALCLVIVTRRPVVAWSPPPNIFVLPPGAAGHPPQLPPAWDASRLLPPPPEVALLAARPGVRQKRNEEAIA